MLGYALRRADSPEDAADVVSETFMIAWRRLDEADRELLTLVAWEGLDRDQIAAMLGCSRATIRVRLHRARRRLARLLGEEGHHGLRPSQFTSTQFRSIPLPAQRDGNERFSALAGARDERTQAR